MLPKKEVHIHSHRKELLIQPTDNESNMQIAEVALKCESWNAILIFLSGGTVNNDDITIILFFIDIAVLVITAVIAVAVRVNITVSVTT